MLLGRAPLLFSALLGSLLLGFGCGSSSSDESPCASLASCCASSGLPAKLAEACNSVASSATPTDCSTLQNTYASEGYCSVPTSPEGGVGCSGLVACCMAADFPAAEVASCIEVGNSATEAECTAALADYEKAGACSTGGGGSVPKQLGEAGAAHVPVSSLSLQLVVSGKISATADVSAVTCDSDHVSFPFPFSGYSGDTVILSPMTPGPSGLQPATAEVDGAMANELWYGTVTGDVTTKPSISTTVDSFMMPRAAGGAYLTLSGSYICPM
jgi:hypothetical protein